jgi:hypothetical protein
MDSLEKLVSMAEAMVTPDDETTEKVFEAMVADYESRKEEMTYREIVQLFNIQLFTNQARSFIELIQKLIRDDHVSTEGMMLVLPTLAAQCKKVTVTSLALQQLEELYGPESEDSC